MDHQVAAYALKGFRYFIFCVAFFLSGHSVFGETIAQLEQKAKDAQGRVNKVEALVKLGKAYLDAGFIDKAKTSANEAKKLAQDEKYVIGEVKAKMLLNSIEKAEKKSKTTTTPATSVPPASSSVITTTSPVSEGTKTDLFEKQRELQKESYDLNERLKMSEASNQSKDAELLKIYDELELKNVELQRKELELFLKNDSMIAKERMLKEQMSELEQKEKEIDVLSREKEIGELKAKRAQLRNYLFGSVAALIIIIALILIFSLRSNRKKQLQLSTTLSELKTTQLHLVQSEKMASLGQLTAGIAHEINNPVNFVSGSIGSLKRDINDMRQVLSLYESGKATEAEEFKKKNDFAYTLQEITELLTGIEEGANRTTEIVKGLRNFSRLDESELKEYDVNEGIESSLKLVQNRLLGKVELIKKYNCNTLTQAYAGQLNQVWLNLLNNAIDAIHHKGSIEIETSNTENDIQVTIKDSGHGMSNEVKAKMFEPFYTTKDVGKGTGLGLSISYGIIEKHEGRITVDSTEGAGTSITIHLPVTINQKT